MKCAQHLLNFGAALRWALYIEAGWKSCRDRPLSVGNVYIVSQSNVDPIDRPEAVERQLGRRNIHQRKVSVEHASRSITIENASHLQRYNLVISQQTYRVSDVKRMTLGKRPRENHSLWIGK